MARRLVKVRYRVKSGTRGGRANDHLGRCDSNFSKAVPPHAKCLIRRTAAKCFGGGGLPLGGVVNEDATRCNERKEGRKILSRRTGAQREWDGRTKGMSMSRWKRSILTTTLNLCVLLVAG